MIPVGSALNHLQGWFKRWSHQDQWNVLAKMADIMLPAVHHWHQPWRQRLPRLFLDRIDLLETFRPEQVRRKYQFWPTQIIQLMQIRNRLDPAMEGSFTIPAIIKCAALRFFACGTYLDVVGDVLVYRSFPNHKLVDITSVVFFMLRLGHSQMWVIMLKCIWQKHISKLMSNYKWAMNFVNVCPYVILWWYCMAGASLQWKIIDNYEPSCRCYIQN